ncbi:HNH endonuclease [Subtercola endophyticus]|uniref:HNH endonuclease n=1 Tax=Subtercola endophyticus TaxID=2895559 RepID=UPI001E4189E6|nr:HNH endonuclease [Subtercola endophyticus]UFS60193.1 DUF222 domain-containing protein [Subtercola endophyticus]
MIYFNHDRAIFNPFCSPVATDDAVSVWVTSEVFTAEPFAADPFAAKCFAGVRFICEDDVVESVPVEELRDVLALAVREVIDGARAIAEAQADQAVRIERVRRARLELRPVDRSAGGTAGTSGTGWSAEAVAEREVVTELAAALHLNEPDARRAVETSSRLTADFPETLDALRRGMISYRHAEKIVQHSFVLADDVLADYERRVLPVAETVSVQRLEREARAAVESAQPTTAIERHLEAAKTRRVYVEPGADGMAYLTHYLPAVEALAIYNRATELARSLKNAGDPRTLTQLRADALTDLMLNGETSIPGATRGIRPHVRLTVPVLTLLGAVPTQIGPQRTAPADLDPTHCDPTYLDPAQLEGFGPIDRLTALELARDAPSLVRVLTDPITGCVLNYGRQRYKPPAELDELVRLAYQECTFPISCTSSAVAELDHTRAWSEGGETSFGNIAPLCSTHHKVKHHTEWKVEQDPGGSGIITWTSPAGFAYRVEPTPIVRPKPRFTEWHPARSADSRAPLVTSNPHGVQTDPPF